MTAFFNNPEMLRNARIQLRPGRAIAAVVICAAISLTIWYSFESRMPCSRSIYDSIAMFKIHSAVANSGAANRRGNLRAAVRSSRKRAEHFRLPARDAPHILRTCHR